MSPEPYAASRARSIPGLARGFRPFFALAALHASLFIPAWVALTSGWISAPPWLSPPLWHAHEMIYGFAAAAGSGASGALFAGAFATYLVV